MKFSVSEQEFLYAHRLRILPIKLPQVLRFAAVCFLCVPAVAALYIYATRGIFAWFAMIPGIALLMFVWAYYKKKGILKRVYRQQSAFRSEIEIVAHGDRIEINSKNGNNFFKYGQLHKVEQDDQMLWIYISEAHFQMVPLLNEEALALANEITRNFQSQKVQKS